MLREGLMESGLGRPLDHDPDFRWRGNTVTRIENLSDIAFALALTMIISGSIVPSTFAELREFLFFFVPTAAAFAIMLQIWTAHYTFFRRFGVADKRIIVLNALLIFVILYLAYPLRFTFHSLYVWVIGLATGDYTRGTAMGMTFETGVWTISVFVVAQAAAFILLAMMYGHALRKRDWLALNPAEEARTRTVRAGLWWAAGVSLLVVPLAMITPLGPMAAFLLFLQSPGYWLAGQHYFKGVETASHSGV